MKNAVLILLLILLPWQSVVAAERNLTHVLGAGHGMEFVVHHMAEHASHVLHHHDDADDDGDEVHVDKSQKSVQHLADFEHANNACPMLPAAFDVPDSLPTDREMPLWRSNSFSDRTTSPLLRPPRSLA
jgi:hypothetical protein